ncbi:membrane-spanning 4-domains subfamily A member 15-like [Tachysurus fulvidraco]|uniref:membrane-spanning 4-domains subfamily A member 15-like n=1 Tax=Tachysurus fulvidraco TaxID=1234273 RepID=UPI001FEED4C0|nr:membrane-spanning 4-domains subfamily A member 15-like [Tachysurus fulvidraco]
MPLPAIKTDSKSLGIVQMMIGVVILSFGSQLNDAQPLCVRSGAVYWGSICFLIAGSLSVSAVDHRNPFVVKSSLVMNLLSALAAVLVIIMLSVDLREFSSLIGIIGILELIRRTFVVLLLFSILEVCMAIRTFVLLWKSRDSTDAIVTP